jgi:hypothetical protein
MDPKWQKIFLTVGVLIAVFGMRLVFPVLVVALAAHISPFEALNLGIANPHAYSAHLHHAHATIAAFGGMFLFTLFLDWLAEEKEHHWTPIEKYVETISEPSLVYATAMTTAGAGSLLLHSQGIFVAIPAVLGVISYFILSKADIVLDKVKFASAGLGTFLYLEVLDASFSFDGVIGAFAVTTNIFLIMIGLGIGAAYVRSMTVYLTHKGTLNDYRYLEHGAHWAIFALSMLLLLSIKIEIPDALTGILGVVVIASAYYHSVKINRQKEKYGSLHNQ